MKIPAKKKSGMPVFLVILILTAGFISMIQQFFQWQYKKGTIKDYPVLIQSPKVLKVLSFNFEEIFADIIWLRCVRYIYHHHHIDNKFTYLNDFLNQIVALSPNFIDVYKLGAENLLFVADEPDKAIELLKKGIKYNPDEWVLFYKLGQCYHLGKNDKKTAKYYYTIASRIHGSPPFISTITSNFEYEEKITLYKMWERIYSTTPMKNLKKIARDKMSQISLK